MTLDQKIEAYLNGKLSTEEAKSFAIQIDSDPELAEQVALHRLEEELMNTILADDLNKNIQEWQKEKRQQLEPKNVEKYFSRKWIFFVILLTLFLGLLQVISLIQNSSKKPSDFDTSTSVSEEPSSIPSNKSISGTPTDTTQPNTPPANESIDLPVDSKKKNKGSKNHRESSTSTKGPVAQFNQSVLEDQLYNDFSKKPQIITTITKGQTNSSELLLDSASTYINNNRFEEAIAVLKEVDAKEEENYLMAKFNIANLYYLEDKHQEAIPFYMEMSEQEGIYQHTAQWRLLLSYLKLHQRDEYQVILKQITENPGHLFYSKANELADKLEEFSIKND